MKEFAPLSDTHQALLHNWHVGIYGAVPPLHTRIDQHKQEHGELLKEVDGLSCEEINQITGPKARSLAKEALDVIIANMSIIDCLGFDFENLYYEKLSEMYTKYNVVTINRFVADGESRQEALRLTKDQWNLQIGKSI